MHIGIAAWSLLENRGGIERVSCNLAAALMERGHSVTLLCKDPGKKSAVPLTPLAKGVALQRLQLDYDTRDIGKARSVLAALNLDVLAALFSWESLLWFPGLLKGLDIPLLISEHNAPERILAKWNAPERLCCLDCADAIHVLLQSFAAQYPQHLQKRIAVIANAADCEAAPRHDKKKSARPRIIAAGRFVEPVKQFSLLIRAFALLKDTYPDWDLEVCGDGASMAEYQRLAGSLRLGNRLRLPGMVDDLTSRYADADIFCIPSRVEGFGMVTAEAQAQALPAVGFAACPGTNEIIVHGVNGLLAEEMTPQCLAASLEGLMRDPELRRNLGTRGQEMLERYAPQKIYDAWEDLLRATASRKGKTRIQEIMTQEALTQEALAQDAMTQDAMTQDAMTQDAMTQDAMTQDAMTQDAMTQDAMTSKNAAGRDVHWPEQPSARQLLARTHPFDRSDYLALHQRLKEQGTSPFSEKDIASFRKKQKKFGFPGFRSLLTELRRCLRKFF